MSSKLESVFFASMESTVVLIMEITAARVSSGITRSAVFMLVPCSQHSSGVYLNNPVFEIVVKLISARAFWTCLLWSREDSLPLVRDSELYGFDCLLFISVRFVV